MRFQAIEVAKRTFAGHDSMAYLDPRGRYRQNDRNSIPPKRRGRCAKRPTSDFL
jgi:hypothetical protein